MQPGDPLGIELQMVSSGILEGRSRPYSNYDVPILEFRSHGVACGQSTKKGSRKKHSIQEGYSEDEVVLNEDAVD